MLLLPPETGIIRSYRAYDQSTVCEMFESRGTLLWLIVFVQWPNILWPLRFSVGKSRFQSSEVSFVVYCCPGQPEPLFMSYILLLLFRLTVWVQKDPILDCVAFFRSILQAEPVSVEGSRSSCYLCRSVYCCAPCKGLILRATRYSRSFIDSFVTYSVAMNQLTSSATFFMTSSVSGYLFIKRLISMFFRQLLWPIAPVLLFQAALEA